MMKDTHIEDPYKLWLDYHYGLIQRELTDKEYSDIRASEFAMHFLIPDEQLLKECGGYKQLLNINLSCEDKSIQQLAKKFEVPMDVMLIKIWNLKERKSEFEKNDKNIIKRIKNKLL